MIGGCGSQDVDLSRPAGTVAQAFGTPPTACPSSRPQTSPVCPHHPALLHNLHGRQMLVHPNMRGGRQVPGVVLGDISARAPDILRVSQELEYPRQVHAACASGGVAARRAHSVIAQRADHNAQDQHTGPMEAQDPADPPSTPPAMSAAMRPLAVGAQTAPPQLRLRANPLFDGIPSPLAYNRGTLAWDSSKAQDGPLPMSTSHRPPTAGDARSSPGAPAQVTPCVWPHPNNLGRPGEVDIHPSPDIVGPKGSGPTGIGRGQLARQGELQGKEALRALLSKNMVESKVGPAPWTSKH